MHAVFPWYGCDQHIVPATTRTTSKVLNIIHVQVEASAVWLKYYGIKGGNLEKSLYL